MWGCENGCLARYCVPATTRSECGEVSVSARGRDLEELPVYIRLRENTPAAKDRPRGKLSWRQWLSGNVIALGFTSFLTDISSEMVAAVLPLYFVVVLQLSPLAFGVIDGLYHGAAALVRIASGIVTDRWQRYKEIAAAGYGLSAIAKLGLIAAGATWASVVGVILVDRAGQGIRTSPRDALISLSTKAEYLGRAFGVHRALDTAGALLGPVVAFVILWVAPGEFDAIFVVSFFIAVLGLSVLVLFARNRKPAADAGESKPSVRSAFGLLRDRDFRAVVVAGGLLSLVTLSDGFVYLVLQDRLELRIGLFPLLYVATAAVYLVLAIPAGRLADRIGRRRVFLGGYSLLLGVYAVLLIPDLGAVGALVAIVLFGMFYAATDGVLMAIASSVLPESMRTSGIAELSTVTGIGRLLASVLFGALWTTLGQTEALVAMTVLLVLALGTAGILFVRRTRSTVHA